MEENDLRDLESIFAHVEDPRRERTPILFERWLIFIMNMTYYRCLS
jgi:hypothetical protein